MYTTMDLYLLYWQVHAYNHAQVQLQCHFIRSHTELAVRRYRLVAREGPRFRRYRFGSTFFSKRLWFVDTVWWLCPSLLTETLTWLSSLPILMQESFWWWQCSDRYIISHSTPPFLSPPPPPPPPSLTSLMVSVDLKHHVYLLTKPH